MVNVEVPCLMRIAGLGRSRLWASLRRRLPRHKPSRLDSRGGCPYMSCDAAGIPVSLRGTL